MCVSSFQYFFPGISMLCYMNEVILSLSKETDDEKRRERLAGILDSELAYDKNAGEEVDTNESPRFAQLFQTSLDIVGQEIQTAATYCRV